MNIYTIYYCLNKINNKAYIGFDSNWPSRMNRHIAISQKGEGYRLHDAIRKYGEDQFEWTILYQSKDKYHTLNTMEPLFISEYKTTESGYNISEGGAGVIGVVKDTIWVNNGLECRRIPTVEDIPSGWVRGRLKTKRSIKMSEETKKIIGSKNKNRGFMANLNKIKSPCPHCGIPMNKGNLALHIKARHT